MTATTVLHLHYADAAHNAAAQRPTDARIARAWLALQRVCGVPEIEAERLRERHWRLLKGVTRG